jgi:hypothetical protein
VTSYSSSTDSPGPKQPLSILGSMIYPRQQVRADDWASGIQLTHLDGPDGLHEAEVSILNEGTRLQSCEHSKSLIAISSA